MYKSIINDLKIFGKHLSLLIVEDEVELREELVSFFESFFKNVKYAQNGVEALELYKKNIFDIVITDLNMPKMNGIELSRQIRTLNKNQVIIVLSGYIDDYVIDLIDIGIQALIIKPYKLENFLQKVLVQCENIILKKEFDKIKLDKTLQKNSHKPPKEIKFTTIETIAKEIVDCKDINQMVKEYKETFSVDEEIDDTMWMYLSSDIEDLNSSYEDVVNLITLNGMSEKYKSDLIKIFNRYHSILTLIPGLNPLSLIFSDLSDVLEDLDLNFFKNKSEEIFDVFEYFYDDIINFFNVVFINKESKNITYLTDSFRSSVEQFKNNLGLTISVDDEMELF
jgi:CheY-like chemotaxis protein